MKILIKAAAAAAALTLTLCTAIAASAAENTAFDVNGDGVVDINDTTVIQKFLVGFEDLPDSALEIADCNGDGVVDIGDATYLQKELAGYFSKIELKEEPKEEPQEQPNEKPQDEPQEEPQGEATGDEAVEPSNLPTEISLNTSSVKLSVGERYELSFEADKSGFTYEYSSSDSSVASVSAEGEITALSEGKATVTLTAENGLKASCTVTVKGSAVKCLDVSYAQGSIDFEKVKAAGYDYVIIRAGYGKDSGQEDKWFKTNYENAKAAGLKVGAYWYSYATTVSEAAEEAENCLKSISGKSFDLPVFYDIEESSQAALSADTLNAMFDKFCSILESKGFEAGIYTYKSLMSGLDLEKLGKDYAIWCAQWNDTCAISCDVWQYTDSAAVSGISGYVDCSYIFNLNIVG